MTSRNEMETTIGWDEAVPVYRIFTSSPTVKRLLERRGASIKRADRYKGEEIGWFFELSKSSWLISIRQRSKINPQASEAARQRLKAHPIHKKSESSRSIVAPTQ